jgi:hypothetical protein
MFVRLNQGEGRLVFPHRFDGIASGGRNNVKRPHLGVAISDTWLVNPQTTMDLRIGYARGIENNLPWSDGFDPATLGFASSFANLIQSRDFPTIRVAEIETLADSPFIYNPP